MQGLYEEPVSSVLCGFDNWCVVRGDMREVLTCMPDASVDSIVTDPPYGISFMGKGWDHGVPGVEFWTECLRVLKPGGHVLSFGGTRMFHRLTSAIEDAGFDIRDCLMWMYGSGFPKSHDVSKAIDKAAGAERRRIPGARSGGMASLNRGNQKQAYRDKAYYDDGNNMVSNDPVTPEAAVWNGWGTALKPAWEPVIMARKPLDGTVAANVLGHGTGALNIDGCRVGSEVRVNNAASPTSASRKSRVASGYRSDAGIGPGSVEKKVAGRWPANVVLQHTERCRCVGKRKAKGYKINRFKDGAKPFGGGAGHEYDSSDAGGGERDVWECSPDCPIRLLDEQTGNRPGCKSPSDAKPESKFRPNQGNYQQQGPIYGDNGGASRFFYCAKTAKRERNAGLSEGSTNNHPTVKPIGLMRYLCRLVTPPGGLVLDPFCGSGSTGCAAVQEGFRFIGVDIDNDDNVEAVKIARARIRYWESNGS